MIPILALALAGGLILNVMPCVLPVLALKAFKVVDQVRLDPAQRRKHGFAYTLGTVSLFVALALVVVALRAAGKQMGWGMQFQHPPFVASMTAIVFAFALNALGVFEITISSSSGPAKEDTFAGSYANGVFAALMSTPCSAPFLGTAVAFALGADTAAWQTLLIFALIGFGLAIPYLLMTLVPAFARVLPRPGAWMETVKHVMGFTLIATAVWLFRTLQRQVTPESANSFLFFLTALAFALWFGGKFGGLAASALRRWAIRGGQVGGLALLAWGFVTFEPALKPAQATPASAQLEDVLKDGHIAWVDYSVDRIKAERARNRPVFLDFTAEWCAACKANEKAFLETDAVRGALQRTGILPMRADMTNEDPVLQAALDDLGRSGIPAYVVLFPDGTRDLLPITITADLVVDRLEKASNRFPREKFAAQP